MLQCDWEPAKFLIFSGNVFDNLIYFSHLAPLIISLIVGILVFRSNKKALINRVFLFLSLSFSLWVYFDLILWATEKPVYVMFFWSIMTPIELLMYTFALYLTYLFIYRKSAPFFSKIIIGLFFLPLIFFTHTKYNVSAFDFTNCDRGALEGPLLKYIYIIEVLYAIWILVIAIKKYISSDKSFRRQILFFLLGILFFLLAFSIGNLTLVMELDWKYEQYKLFGMPVFIAFLSYLILKYQAFDIKVIAGQFLIVSLWIAVFSQFFIVQSSFNFTITIIELAIVTVLGWFLFRSVKQEVQTAKELGAVSSRLQGLNDKLRQLDQAKSEFISIASHQLRTPLTSIKGFSSLILENTFGRLPVKIKQPIENIFVNNEKLVLLVEDMLNVSRLEAGRLQYDLEETEVLLLVKKTVDNLRLYAKTKKLVMKLIEPKGKLPLVLADQRKLSEIISNLIDNAIKYTPHGQIEISVEKFKKAQRAGVSQNSAVFNGHWIKIQVKDTGIGMTEEETKSIFEKFQKGPADQRDSLQAVGTGLGVFISRQTTEAMNGHLYAESAGPGRGSTFILELPGLKRKS